MRYMTTASFFATAATVRRRPGERRTYSHNTADQRGQCSRKGKQRRVGRKIYLIAHKQELTSKRLTSGECTQSIAKDFGVSRTSISRLQRCFAMSAHPVHPKTHDGTNAAIESVKPPLVGSCSARAITEAISPTPRLLSSPVQTG